MTAPVAPQSVSVLAGEASALAAHLPALSVLAAQVAASVAHGVHGRKKAGSGDQFWQFRPYIAGDAVSQIDWRRSARSEHVILREREWQSAQTLWLWIDRGVSMQFASAGAIHSKADAAVIMGLALADILVRGGERVGLIGQGRSVARRDVIQFFAESLLRQRAEQLPSEQPLARNSQGIWISDFLLPLAQIEARLSLLAAQGAKGVLLHISDRQEQLFPFEGHVEFADSALRARLKLGQAELARGGYLHAYAAHKDGLRALAARFGWRMTEHCTDRSMASCLLGLSAQLRAA